MAVVNANYEFIMVDVGTNGLVSDGGVLQNTTFGKKLKNNAQISHHLHCCLEVPENSHIFLLGMMPFQSLKIY